MAKKYKVKPNRQASTTYELSIIQGIESVALEEVHERLKLKQKANVSAGAIRLQYSGSPRDLLQLDTIVAAFQVVTFDVPRPKALLGHQHFTRLVEHINSVCAQFPKAEFQTLHIDAAGKRSTVMQRLVDELASVTSLQVGLYEGDLLIRLRPTQDKTAWEALIRISPRPNSTRSWRVENFKGALNASVAHAMARLSQPKPEDIVLNVLAGSGTIAIERLRLMSGARVMACEIDHEVLAMAQANIAAANMASEIELTQWDATGLPLAPRSVDVIFADLPFGNYVGSHDTNIELYPAVLNEAARVLKTDGVFVLITHEIKLTDAILLRNSKWVIEREFRINLNGLHPHIYILALA